MKRGDLSFNTIVVAILAVIVLVVLAIIFHKQLAMLLKPLTETIESATSLSSDISGLVSD
tara:strand:- start:177 stop:356 length:180 start_codon:yes stop_codon:yes gene_type:complete